MSREEKINKMIEEIKIRRNDEQYKGGPFPIYHIEFDILNEEIERVNNIINELEHHLYQEWLEWKDSDSESIYSRAGEDKAIYDYIQELKGEELDDVRPYDELDEILELERDNLSSMKQYPIERDVFL